MTGVAALAGAAVAWFAAVASGQYRDGRVPAPKILDWSKSFEWRKPSRGI
jgi:nitrogen fixation-related uncharacterized protein